LEQALQDKGSGAFEREMLRLDKLSWKSIARWLARVIQFLNYSFLSLSIGA
jgi:hypothetical protein